MSANRSRPILCFCLLLSFGLWFSDWNFRKGVDRLTAGSTSKKAYVRAQLLTILGGMAEGDAIAPERKLAEELGVSRMTLRSAVDDLVTEGTLERRPGSGTFLTRPRMSRRLVMTSFTEDMIRRGLVPSSRILSFGVRKADHSLSRRLRIPIGDPVVCFERLRMADGEPLAVETSMIRADLVPQLSEKDLEGSWYELLAERYGLTIDRATLEVEPVLPRPQIAEWLTVPTTQSSLRLTVQSFGRNGGIIEAGVSIYRGDIYKLSAELAIPDLAALRSKTLQSQHP